MKTNLKIIAALTLVVITLSSFMQPEPNRLLPEKLRGIDYGIVGSHFPNPTYAVYEDGFYVWKHDTSVSSQLEDLQIVEYGSYVYTDKGWYLRITMSPEEFAATYHCKNAILKKGKIYTDGESWRRDKNLISGDAMWYYIAKDKTGKRYKGTALVETEAKLVAEKELVKKVIVDTKKSSFKWTGYAEVGSYSLTGNIALKSGELVIADGKISSGKMVINVTTIQHSDTHLTEHLKSEDFFDVEKYPEAILTIISSKKIENGQIEVHASITIKAKTKPIVFKMKIDGEGYSGKIKIDRTDFGVQYGSNNFFDNLGDRAIRNDFDLEFNLKLK